MRGWIAALAALALTASARAEEGMWTFQNLPEAAMRAAYGGWAPDQAWRERVSASSVRLASGCSGAVMSGAGLVLTNHHCVSACLAALGGDGANLLAEGFAAAGRGEERRCPGLVVDAPLSATDVTEEIERAAGGAPPALFAIARDAAFGRLVAACEQSADSCEVVTLYQGGQYWLYAYRRFEDVRLVFAPEGAAAHYGGAAANFQFPRFAFDVALLRLYENGSPARTPTHLSLRARPLSEGEPALIAGYPGATERLLTSAQRRFQRDVALPFRIALLREWSAQLSAYAAPDARAAQAAADELYTVENLLKALEGRRAALADAALMAAADNAEAAFRAHLARDSVLAPVAAGAWEEIEAASNRRRAAYAAYQLAEPRLGQGSDLMLWARHIVRAADAAAGPDASRLPAYRAGRLEATRASVLREMQLDAGLEQARIASWLTAIAAELPASHPLRQRALGAETPEALAARLVQGTALFSSAARRALWNGGSNAVASSADPLIVFMRGWESEARALRQQYETEVEGPIVRAQERIAQARFRAFGDTLYPDATFTLRLSHGRVAGWREGGAAVPALTRLGALWSGADPVSPRWLAAAGALDNGLAFNAVTTNDTIGGYSGSPVLDRDGQVIGAAFDGNMHSLGGAYHYDGARNRTVIVTAEIIDAALRRVYGLDALADELAGR